jgi:hypothetical protein
LHQAAIEIEQVKFNEEVIGYAALWSATKRLAAFAISASDPRGNILAMRH